MRYLLLLAPIGFLLASCGSSQTNFRDYDGSYSWSNSQAYREGYDRGYQQGYQEGADDQAAQEDQEGRPVRTTRTRTIVRYEYYPTYYYGWSNPWMLHHPGAFYQHPGRWNRASRWNSWGYSWHDPWMWNTWGSGWNDPWMMHSWGGSWYQPWGSPWGNPWGGTFGYPYGYGFYGGYGYYGGSWGNPYYRRYDRWNRPGGGLVQPGGGTASPLPESDLRRQQISNGTSPGRRPVVTNNPGGGNIGTPQTDLPADRQTDFNSPKSSDRNRPGALEETLPTRGTPSPRPPQQLQTPERRPETRPSSGSTPQAPASREPQRSNPTPPPAREPQRSNPTPPPAREPQRSNPTPPPSRTPAPAPAPAPAPQRSSERPAPQRGGGR